MMDWLKLVHGESSQTSPAAFQPGDEVRVWFKILEQGKERLGQFEGIVIRYRGSGPSKTFTVRRITHGEGVERVFPVDAKTISRIEVLRQGRVKRSRLYFLRNVVGKTRIDAADTSSAPEKSSGTPGTEPPALGRSAPERTESAVAAADRPASNPTDQP